MNSTDDSPQENFRVAEPGSLVERLENELEAKLNAYLDGSITLHDLRVWISDQPYAMPEPSRRLMILYARSQSRILRFDSGTWTQGDLKQSLRYVLHIANTDTLPDFDDPLQFPEDIARLNTLSPKRPESQ